MTVRFNATQVAGDLNVVVVGWGDTTAAVGTVTDSVGNVYRLAVGPTAISGTATQAIYYAANIVGAAAGANSVTVSFTAAAIYPDIRLAEYSGIDPNNPLDVVASATGNSAASATPAGDDHLRERSARRCQSRAEPDDHRRVRLHAPG